jgi:cold shock CspA family protein
MSGFVSQSSQVQRLVASPMAKKLSSQDLEKLKQKQEIIRLQKLLKNRLELWELTFGEVYTDTTDKEKNDDDGSSVSSQNTHSSNVNSQNFETQHYAAYLPHIAAQMGYMSSYPTGSYPTTPSVSPVMMQSYSPAAMYYYPYPDQYHQQQQNHQQMTQQNTNTTDTDSVQMQAPQMQSPQMQAQDSLSKTSSKSSIEKVETKNEVKNEVKDEVKDQRKDLSNEKEKNVVKLQIQIPQSLNYAAIASKTVLSEKSDKSDKLAEKSDKSLEKSKAETCLQEVTNSKSIEITRQQVLSCNQAQIWIDKIYNFVSEKKDWVNFADLAQPQNGLQKPEECSSMKLKLILLSDCRFLVEGDRVKVDESQSKNEVLKKESMNEQSFSSITYTGFVYAKPADGTHIFMNFKANENANNKQLYTDQCIWLEDQKKKGLKNANVSSFRMIDGIKYGQNLIAYRSKSDADVFDSLNVGDEVLFFIEKDGLKSTAVDIIRK